MHTCMHTHTHTHKHTHKHPSKDCLSKLQTSSDLQLSQRAIKVEDSIAFLQLLSLLLGRRQDHGQVGSVHLKEDGVFTAY